MMMMSLCFALRYSPYHSQLFPFVRLLRTIKRRSITLIPLKFISFSHLPLALSTCRYNISWNVDSHTPVEEFKLYFRRLPQGHEIENSIEHSQQPLQHHGSSNGIGSNGQPHRYGNVIMHWSRNDWRDVVLPAVPLSHHYTQGMSYMIRGLDPDNQYEARVQARYVQFTSCTGYFYPEENPIHCFFAVVVPLIFTECVSYG